MAEPGGFIGGDTFDAGLGEAAGRVGIIDGPNEEPQTGLLDLLDEGGVDGALMTQVQAVDAG